jgi:hypothetical protein
VELEAVLLEAVPAIQLESYQRVWVQVAGGASFPDGCSCRNLFEGLNFSGGPRPSRRESGGAGTRLLAEP